MKMENLCGAINATKGQDNTFSITLNYDDGSSVPPSEEVALLINNIPYTGTYDEEEECWWFTIPADTTSETVLYNVTVNGETLMFSDKIRSF